MYPLVLDLVLAGELRCPCSVTAFLSFVYCENPQTQKVHSVCKKLYINVVEYFSLCVFRVQNIVPSVETFRTASSAWIIVPAVWRRISKLCGSTAMLQDTACHATPTARCREWKSNASTQWQYTHNENHFTPSVFLFQMHCDGWERVPHW